MLVNITHTLDMVTMSNLDEAVGKYLIRTEAPSTAFGRMGTWVVLTTQRIFVVQRDGSCVSLLWHAVQSYSVSPSASSDAVVVEIATENDQLRFQVGSPMKGFLTGEFVKTITALAGSA